MNAKPLCIYHANCADGFAAAWVVRHFFGNGNVEFHPGVYGEAPPDVTGRDVIIVDFSYKHDVLASMIEQAESFTLIDHHKTAFVETEGLTNARIVLSTDMSGAGLAWQYYFGSNRVPTLIKHIEDRDLWAFKLEGTREITAALFSYPYDFAVYDQLMEDTDRLATIGAALVRKHKQDCAALIEKAVRRMIIGKNIVSVANVPWMYASDVAGQLAIGEPFAASYYDSEDGRHFSLRSDAKGLDVSLIAEQFGGGGHMRAAGFRLSPEDAIDMEICGGWGL